MSPATRSPRRTHKASAADAPRGRPAELSGQALQEVYERVLRARIRLSMQQPFLASAVMRLPVRPVTGASWCPTAATDGYHVFYNPQWVADLREDELRGLLAHEVMHVLFSHADRRQERDSQVWNMACDFAINYLLIQRGFSLPEGGLISTCAQGKTSEQLYAELMQQKKAPDGSPTQNGGKSLRKKLGGPARSDDPLADESRDRVPDAGADLIDADDPRVRPVRSADAPDREQMAELRRELREEALARLSGDSAGSFRSECEADDARRVDWRSLLRAHLSERIKGDWTSFPFSKRMVHRGLFMPSAGMQVPGHVVFAIDTSASMSLDLLAGIAGELQSFREVFPCRLTVLQCDARLQSVEHYEAMDGYEIPKRLEIHGRGGTDFCPVFNWVAEQSDAALVIYATDGIGGFPARKPEVPVIWLHTPPHPPSAVFPFGVVVKITQS
jgi:predicted metal-dependent peptidase